MKLKCIKDNNGYFQEGECYEVKEVKDYLTKVIIGIEVTAGWTYDKPDIYDIECTKEEFESSIIRGSIANFEIIQ